MSLCVLYKVVYKPIQIPFSNFSSIIAFNDQKPDKTRLALQN